VKFLPLMRMISRLGSLERFSMEKLSARESVLEHVGCVALLTYAMMSELHLSHDNRALEKAVIHDFEEIVTGDVARPTKAAAPELFDSLAAKAIGILAAEIDAIGMPVWSTTMRIDFQFAKLGQDGAVVALADMLAVVIKVWEEVILRGNKTMIRQAHTVRRQLDLFAAEPLEDNFKGADKLFLSAIVDEARAVADEAISRDDRWLATKVEEY
jgi:5'-deoxynucleotidase YfbR-like HD superfamily hydrolase